MLGAPSDFWGKLRKDGDVVVAWHPLEDHCADVAATCEALLSRTLLGARLAALAGVHELSAPTIARLGVLAALHDIGKFNVGFQNKALASPPFKAGHVREVLVLIGHPDYEVGKRLADALPVDELATWGPEETPFRLLAASIGHHGRPHAVDDTSAFHGTVPDKPWRAARGIDPFEGIRRLVASTRTWFPEAFESCASPLPEAAPFAHAFAGLVMLADWLGSDTRFFPYGEARGNRMAFAREAARTALEGVGLDAASARASLGSARPTFDRVTKFPPRAVQQAVVELPEDVRGSVTILEAETGSGKTEAACARYLRLFHAGLVDGMYFALPTRTAATQLHRRVVEVAKRAFAGAEPPPVVLAVPGYIAVDDQTAVRLPEFEVLWNDDVRARFRFRGWAAEHPKRFLVGPIVVGTIDQVLLGALMVDHAHMRSTALLRHLLVVDEVHASDAYMTRLLEEVLRTHSAAGGHTLLMSATLGVSAQEKLLAAGGARPTSRSLDDAISVPYPLVTHCARGGAPVRRAVADPGLPKEISIALDPMIDDPERIASRALAAARTGARVLVLRNTVRSCVDTQRALEALAASHDRGDLLFQCAEVPAPHHARFAKRDREALDHAIERAFGRDAPEGVGCVVVATQTVQQSLDLDADLLLTDLCPMDVLLQRMGRLHRHPWRKKRPADFARPTAVVLVPAERNLAEMLRPSGDARGGFGFGSVYDDLRVLEATWRALEQNASLRIPEMNRELVERTTHPEALARLVVELGEVWGAHERRVLGRMFADRGLAHLNVIDRTIPMGDAHFPDAGIDQRISTRLGEGDRRVVLSPPVLGPFRIPVAELTLPAWLARDISGDPQQSVTPHSSGSGFRLTLDGQSFVYDRLGLRRAEDSQEEDLSDA